MIISKSRDLVIGPEPRQGLPANGRPLPPIYGRWANCQSASVPLCFICMLVSVSGLRRWKWDLDHALREAAPIGCSASWLL